MNDQYGNEQLHRVLLSAMRDVDRICREHHLRYFLFAGTLLGAVNHRGFIPWDDDVDIAMFYEDYRQFAQIIAAEYSQRYLLQTYENDPGHRHNRAVLRVLGTRLEYHHEAPCRNHREIGLDIAPLYPVPDSRPVQKLQQGIIWLLDAAVQVKYGDIVPQRLLTKPLYLLAWLPRGLLGRCIDLAMRHMGSRHSRQVGILCNTGVNPYTGVSGYDNDNILRAWCENPIWVPFETERFMTISQPEQDLLRRYGPHYAEPYPEEKRITKHDVCGYELSQQVRERIRQQDG